MSNEENVPVLHGKSPKQKMMLAAFPLTPAPLTGKNAGYGWGRLAVYGGLSYLSWKRYRKLSYLFGGLAVTSAVTSIAGQAWNNANGELQ